MQSSQSNTPDSCPGQACEATAKHALLLTEELHVLLMDRRRGDLLHIGDRNVRYAFAGAALMDLSRMGHVDADLERLNVVDSTPPGDDILAPLLEFICAADDGADTVYWIEQFSAPEIAHQIRRRTAERLTARGIFHRDPGGTLSLDKTVDLTRRYPGVPLPEGQDVLLRVMNVIFSDDIPTPDETMLIALVDACGLFERFLTKSEIEERRGRISLVRDMDLFGLSVRRCTR